MNRLRKTWRNHITARFDERKKQPRAGGFHVGSAESCELCVRKQLAKRANQVGRVEIAAGLTT